LGSRVAGGIQDHEKQDPMYRHAGINLYLDARYQGQGAASEAIGPLATSCFWPMGVMSQCERGGPEGRPRRGDLPAAKCGGRPSKAEPADDTGPAALRAALISKTA